MRNSAYIYPDHGRIWLTQRVLRQQGAIQMPHSARLLIESVYGCLLYTSQIASEKLLIVVTSTQGEGEPPEEAVALHKFLFSKKAPKLENTAFAVFSLGDSSYEFFCQSGKDFDSKLAELGGERLLDRVDADVCILYTSRLHGASICQVTSLDIPTVSVRKSHWGNALTATLQTEKRPLCLSLARQAGALKNATLPLSLIHI